MLRTRTQASDADVPDRVQADVSSLGFVPSGIQSSPRNANSLGEQSIDVRSLIGPENSSADQSGVTSTAPVEPGNRDKWILSSIGGEPVWLSPAAMTGLPYIPLAGTEPLKPVTGGVRFRGGDPGFWYYDSAEIRGYRNTLGLFGNGEGTLRLGTGIDGLDNPSFPPFQMYGVGSGIAQLESNHHIRDTSSPTHVDDLARKGYVDLHVPKSLVDAKGDLLVGTANDTVARKAVGVAGQVLTPDTAQSDGLRWSTQLQAAKIGLDPSVGVSHTSTGNWQKVPFNTAQFTTVGMTFDTTNNRLIANRAGYYAISANMAFQLNLTAPAVALIEVRKNGAQTWESAITALTAPKANESLIFPMIVMYLDPTHYIELWAYQNSGGNVAYQQDPRYCLMSVYCIQA